MRVKAKTMKALKALAKVKESRYAIAGILVSESHIEATDAMILAIVGDVPDRPREEYDEQIFEIPNIPKTRKRDMFNGELEMSVLPATQGTFPMLKLGNAKGETTSGGVMEGCYPKTFEAIPQGEPVATVRVDPSRLRTLLDVFISETEDEETPAVDLVIYPDTLSTKWTKPCPQAMKLVSKTALGVIMPVRPLED